jgi:hypothetical protein
MTIDSMWDSSERTREMGMECSGGKMGELIGESGRMGSSMEMDISEQQTQTRKLEGIGRMGKEYAG